QPVLQHIVLEGRYDFPELQVDDEVREECDLDITIEDGFQARCEEDRIPAPAPYLALKPGQALNGTERERGWECHVGQVVNEAKARQRLALRFDHHMNDAQDVERGAKPHQPSTQRRPKYQQEKEGARSVQIA